MGFFETVLAFTAAQYLVYFSAFVLAGLLFYSSHVDSLVLAVITFVGILLLINYGFGYSILAAIAANPLLIFALVFGFVLIGILVTMFWKLPNWLHERSDMIKNKYTHYRKHKIVSADTTEEQLYDMFMDSTDYNEFMIRHNKQMVFTWIVLWPFALIENAFFKPFEWIGEFCSSIYYGIGTVLENLNRRITRRILSRK